MTAKLSMISKFVLTAAMALTLGASAAMAENTHRHGGPGVVINQDNVLSAEIAHASQGG